MKVRPKVKRIIGLTGTPSSNGLMDLWAEFKLLDMGQRLGRFITQYRNDYFLPDKRNGQIIYSYKPMPYAEDAIYRKISDMTISMKSTDHLKMPELVSSRYEVKLSEAEAQRYDDLKQELILQLPEGEVTAANAASLTGKLVQLANGAMPATSQTASEVVTAMNEDQFEREKLYQATMNMFRSMLKKGLITEEQYAIIDTKMLQKYQPLLGTLFAAQPLT